MKNKAIKIFGIGAVALMILMTFASVVSAAHFHAPSGEELERAERFYKKAKGMLQSFWDWLKSLEFEYPMEPGRQPFDWEGHPGGWDPL